METRTGVTFRGPGRTGLGSTGRYTSKKVCSSLSSRSASSFDTGERKEREGSRENQCAESSAMRSRNNRAYCKNQKLKSGMREETKLKK